MQWPWTKTKKQTPQEAAMARITEILDELNSLTPYMPRGYSIWVDRKARPYQVIVQKFEFTAEQIHPIPFRRPG